MLFFVELFNNLLICVDRLLRNSLLVIRNSIFAQPKNEERDVAISCRPDAVIKFRGEASP